MTKEGTATGRSLVIPAESKKIPLTQGFYAVVDDEDYELLSKSSWYYLRGYAATNSYNKVTRKNYHARMHRIILGVDKGIIVDHINRDRLDNRRQNLRTCTPSQNSANRKKTRGTSQYKGVSWLRKTKRWQVGLAKNGRWRYIGIFSDEKEAALAYDKAAKLAHGSFACLNFPTL